MVFLLTPPYFGGCSNLNTTRFNWLLPSLYQTNSYKTKQRHNNLKELSIDYLFILS